MDSLVEKAHLTRESNHDAAILAAFYSRALDYWGVEMQKSGQLTNAAAHFERALELNPDNLVAQVNLECNKNLQAGRKSSVQVSKSIEDEFGKYRNWDQIIGENGPFDEPNFCYEQGRVFVRNNLYRQAAAQFDRVKTLAPENLVARIWLSQLYVVSRMPGQALKLVDQIRAQPDLLEAARTNRTELLFVEASAHLAQNDLQGAEAAVQATVRQYPGDADLLATATQVYMKYGRYSNALTTIEQQLNLAPTNMNALVNKGYRLHPGRRLRAGHSPAHPGVGHGHQQLLRAAQPRHRLPARRQTRGRPARLRGPAKGLSDRFPDLLRPG